MNVYRSCTAALRVCLRLPRVDCNAGRRHMHVTHVRHPQRAMRRRAARGLILVPVRAGGPRAADQPRRARVPRRVCRDARAGQRAPVLGAYACSSQCCMRRRPTLSTDRRVCCHEIAARTYWLHVCCRAMRSCGDAQHIIPYLLGWSEMMVQTPNIISGAAGPESGGGPPF